MKFFFRKMVSVLLSATIIAGFTVNSVCLTDKTADDPSAAKIVTEKPTYEKTSIIKALDNTETVPAAQAFESTAPAGVGVSANISCCETARAGKNAAAPTASNCGARLSNVPKVIYDISTYLMNDIVSGTTDFPESDYYDIISVFSNEQRAQLSVTAEELGLTKEETRYIDSSHYPEKFHNKAKEALSNRLLAMAETNTVLNALLADFPYDLFWFDKNEGMAFYFEYGINTKSSDIVYDSTDGNFYIKQIDINFGEGGYVYLKVAMPVSDDYWDGYHYDVTDSDGNIIRQPHSFDLSLLQSRVYPAKAAADKIIEDNKDKTDTEKLKAYHDAICNLVSYDNVAAASTTMPYGDPWQMISVFDGDTSTKVVCEGYSKAFKYLCDNSTFTDKTLSCITVTGSLNDDNVEINGGHMWNIVRMGGKNYLVDVTNDDSNSGTSLFLVQPKGGSADTAYIFKYGLTKYLSYVYDSVQSVIFGSELITLSPVYAYGDVNLDGKINVSDCVKIALGTAKGGKLTALEYFLANVNFDSKVDSSDAELIAKYAAGTVKAFKKS